MVNHAIRNLIREGKTRQIRNVIATHQSEGMQTLEMGLNALMAEELIDYETALRVSLFPKEVERPQQFAGVQQYREAQLPPPPPGVVGQAAAPRVTSI